MGDNDPRLFGESSKFTKEEKSIIDAYECGPGDPAAMRLIIDSMDPGFYIGEVVGGDEERKSDAKQQAEAEKSQRKKSGKKMKKQEQKTGWRKGFLNKNK